MRRPSNSVHKKNRRSAKRPNQQGGLKSIQSHLQQPLEEFRKRQNKVLTDWSTELIL